MLLEVWETIVANTGVRIRTNEKVESIVRNESGRFTVRTAKAEYEAAFVVLAIGKRGTPRKLDVPREDLAKVAYRLIEADTYDNNDVAVVGGGDSAVEATLALAKASRNRVTLIHRGKDFPRLRERNRTRLDAAEASGAIRIPARRAHREYCRRVDHRSECSWKARSRRLVSYFSPFRVRRRSRVR